MNPVSKLIGKPGSGFEFKFITANNLRINGLAREMRWGQWMRPPTMPRLPTFLGDCWGHSAKSPMDQGALLEWIAAAHAQAEISLQQASSGDAPETIIQRFERVTDPFGFAFTRSQSIGYCSRAQKKNESRFSLYGQTHGKEQAP